LILVLVFVIIVDVLGELRHGWLFPVIGALTSFVAVGFWSGADQFVVTSQAWSESAAAFECNGFPAYPIVTIVFLMLAVVSAILIFSSQRSGV